MENASKALIMAAGVLIGVLILSLGAYLFVNFSQHASQTYDQIKEDQINQFNSEFVTLQGKSDITIYDVVSIIKKTIEFNDINELNSDDENYIELAVTTTDDKNKYDNTNPAPEISFIGLKKEKIEENFQIWINYDMGKMQPVWDLNDDGHADEEKVVKLPPYKCEVVEYNSDQRVKKIEIKPDSDAWSVWTQPTQP